MQLTINWMNSDGFNSRSFNSEYFKIDPLGYLDALRKGGDMEDIHVLDANGEDVSQTYL